ncbi:uncharacterized protein LOC135685268 isoform X1 [Rhopilema esculentum]|uniref:uncharacterized protein LOC135685268 isoform X1 n=1 Tax=Rhopilema esculentum TaxID=499914 RepID=UPI0031DCBA0A
MLHVWGCGQFGQHGQGSGENVSPMDGVLQELKNETVRLIGCGASHTIIVTDSKKLFGWGNNSNGQLGIKISEKGRNLYERPKLIESFDGDIVGISCGSQTSIIWFKDGSCMRFGKERCHNEGGRSRRSCFDLGKWVKVEIEERYILRRSQVKDVACGARHTMYLTERGLVYASGANNRGQLGLGSKVETSVPQQVTKLPNLVKSIACGSFHSLCLSEEGDVYNWGYGPGCGSGDDLLYPSLVHGVEEMLVSLAAGDSHSVAVSINGNIFAWGSNKEVRARQHRTNQSFGKDCLQGASRFGKIRTKFTTKTIFFLNFPSKHWAFTKNVREFHEVIGPSIVCLFISREQALRSFANMDEMTIYFCFLQGQLEASLSEMQTQVPINLTEVLQIGPSLEIACRDDTTATILQDGTLYMWGKNMWEVLVGGKSTHSFIRGPFKVQTISENVLKVALGSWHVAVILAEQGEDMEVKNLEQNEVCPFWHSGTSKKNFGGNSKINQTRVLGKPSVSDGILLDMELDDFEFIDDNGFKSPHEDQKTERQTKESPQLTLQTTQSKQEKCSSPDSFLLECVERENLSNFENSDRACFGSKEQFGSSFGCNDYLASSSKTDMNANILNNNCKKQIHNKWLRDSKQMLKNCPWTEEVVSRTYRNHRKSYSVKGKTQPLKNPSATMATWNIESILDVTSRLQPPCAKDHGKTEGKQEVGGRKTDIPENMSSRRAAPSCDEIMSLCSVQSLDFSKLRGNEDWKKNKYSRSLTKS